MSEVLLRYVAGTLILEGFDCNKCYPDIQRARGCSLKGVPAPSFSKFESHFCGQDQLWYNCPVAMKTPEQAGVFRLYLHWRDNRPIYPSLLDYPVRLLRQLEVVSSEVNAIEAKKREKR